MDVGSGEKQIIENFRQDNCVSAALVKAFFSELENHAPYISPRQAHDQAKEIVCGNRDDFLCSGSEIPSTKFSTLMRLQKLGTLATANHCIPEPSFDNFRKFIGFHTDKIKTGNLNAAEKIILQTALKRYGQEAAFESPQQPNRVGAVYVTDYDVTDATGASEEILIDRLGLEGWDNEKFCLQIVYARDDMEHTLHVPRIFDGIDFPAFAVVTDCGADEGKTKPLTFPRDQGLPEAVHRGCKVIVNSLVMKDIA